MEWIDLAKEKEPVEGFCELGNETSVSTRDWKL
jgi:hypothetical protein